ncbi:MAG TPA: hypothetical protein VGM94_13695 [Galbitalea sp.]
MNEHVQLAQADLRTERPGRRRRGALKMAGNIAYCVFFGLLFIVSLLLGISSAFSATQRSYSGTFTQHSCESGYRGRCESVGTWVSDNGSMVKKNVQLDGDVNSDGTAPATYTPKDFNNDAENNIVHTSTWAPARFWLPWALVLLFGGLILVRARAMRRKLLSRRAASNP